MVIKYALRGYMLRLSCYALRSMCYVGTPYVLYGTSYTLRVMWIPVSCYVLHVMWDEVRLTWVSLYDFPPLVAFKGRFSFRKWFCFLDLKIKIGWQFHFWNSNFSGKGKRGKYLQGCYFWGVYNIRCQGHNVNELICLSR